MRMSTILAWLAAVLLIGVWPAVARADKVDDLMGQLRTNSDYKVRLNAAMQLGRLGDKRSVPAFVDALKDSEKTVRGVAANALKKLVDSSVDPTLRKRAIGELRRVADNDPDSFVRNQANDAYNALKHLGSGGGSAPAAGGVYVEVGPMADASKQGSGSLIDSMRSTVGKTLVKKAPTFQTNLPPGRPLTKGDLTKAGIKGAFYVDGTLVALGVKTTGSTSEVSCNVSLFIATFPEKSMFAFLKGGAQVQTGTTPKAIDEAKVDCVGAVLEDIVGRQVVPTIQQRAAMPSPGVTP